MITMRLIIRIPVAASSEEWVIRIADLAPSEFVDVKTVRADRIRPVIGGGPIGWETVCFYADFGAAVYCCKANYSTDGGRKRATPDIGNRSFAVLTVTPAGARMFTRFTIDFYFAVLAG